MPTIHALTLTWNGKPLIAKLADSLRLGFLSTGLRCIWHVRDNGSTDGTKEFFDRIYWKQDIRYYYESHNRDNYAKCNNDLFTCALMDSQSLLNINEDYVLFINNDIEIIDPTSLRKMLDLFRDGVGVVGSRLLYPSGKIQHGGVVFPKEYIGLPKHLGVGEAPTKYTSLNREFQAVTFACALVRASCIVGLQNKKIDEDYHWCFDDVNTCLDIVYRQKKRILYCGETNIIHHESETLKKNPINKVYEKHNFAKLRREWGNIVDYDYGKYLTGREGYKVVK